VDSAERAHGAMERDALARSATRDDGVSSASRLVRVRG
jgi:hypothetical protein